MNIMLDLETMGTGPNAAILSIGAVAFELNGLSDEFYISVSLEDSVACGLQMTPETVLWWLKQSKEAIKAFDDGQNVLLDDALYAFSDFVTALAPLESVRMWSNGSDFDCVILRHAFDLRDIQAPWAWYNSRCFRTVSKLCPESQIKRSGTHHHALDDARDQARHLIYCTKKLGGCL